MLEVAELISSGRRVTNKPQPRAYTCTETHTCMHTRAHFKTRPRAPRLGGFGCACSKGGHENARYDMICESSESATGELMHMPTSHRHGGQRVRGKGPEQSAGTAPRFFIPFFPATVMHNRTICYAQAHHMLLVHAAC